jgi:UDP-N-acetylmuramate dehydrogenase
MQFFRDYDLTSHNSYRIQSVGGRVFFPETPEDIVTIFGDDKREKVILGGGYNIILSKPYYDEIDFVIFSRPYSAFSVDGNTIAARAGLSLKALSEAAWEHRLSGLELHYDIPGSVGGAAFMNAGANDVSFGDFVDTVTYFDPAEHLFKTQTRTELMFGYRTSFFLNRPDLIISDAVLSLPDGDRDAIYKKMLDNQADRRSKQPWDYPNAGSVFKRPAGKYVGQLVEQLGLKGKTIGGAMVSQKHGGFIVNHNGKATGSDILELIDLICKAVKGAFGIDLEMEQRVI